MKVRSRRFLTRVVVPLATILLLMAGFQSSFGVPTAHAGDGPLKRVVKGELHPALIHAGTVTRTGPAVSAGLVNSAADEIRQEEADSGGSLSLSAPIGSSPGTLGCSERDKGSDKGGDKGGDKGKGDVRVNQDCTFRRQAEEDITYNPANPNNLVAGQNDSRVGFNQCGIDWSTDNGSHWGDMLPPFRQRINNPPDDAAGVGGDPNNNTINDSPGTFHTYDAASDPINAVDSQGRAFFGCVIFDVFTNASGLFVTQSPAGADGSFYFNIPSTSHGPYIVVEDNSPLVLHDKPFLAADRYASSPNRDNVYVTWTVFKFGTTCAGGTDTSPAYCESPIFGSMSTDHGHTWSTPEEISGASTALCFFGNALGAAEPANACDFDQGSDPVVLPNGDLEVIFNNGNTSANNPNSQQLGVHCTPTGNSTTGTAHLNCAAPAKVGDDISTGEPLCNFGRGPEECIPGAYIRTNDFPRIVTENTQNGHLYAVWQDYRNQEYDIQLSESTDGGLTWSELGTVNPDRGLDHYFAAVDQSPTRGDRIGVSYYRTERVPDENATPPGGFGCPPGTMTIAPFTCSAGPPNSDYVLAGGTGLESVTGTVSPSDYPTPFDFKVVSPVFPPPNGIQSGFNGDYSGLTINKGSDAHPIWSDTRNENPYPENGVPNDEDIFTVNVGLPNGRARLEVGQIGQR